MQATKEAEHRERLSELKLRIEQGKDLVADELDRIANARQHREEAAQCAPPPSSIAVSPILPPLHSSVDPWYAVLALARQRYTV